jgi:hypothetical protein
MGSMARWLLLLLTGCSLTLSGPDPNRPRSKQPTCDTSKTLVALDGVMTGTLAIIAVAAASNNDGSAAVAPGLLAAAFLGSAIHGNNVVNACHQDFESYDQAIAAQQIVPALQPPPQPPPVVAPAPPPPPPPRPATQVAADPWQAFWREVP